MVGQAVPEVLIVLVPHMDAGDRSLWEGDQDERPLSDLGRKQASALREAMKSYRVSTLWSSRAARARETLGPLAKDLGLEIGTIASLAERRQGESDATMGQRGERALDEIRRRVSGGVAVAASHGDIIPATIDRLGLRRKLRIPRLERRGQWFAVSFGADLSVGIELVEAPGFPQ